MPILESLYDNIGKILPPVATAAAIALLLWFVNWLLLRRRPDLGTEDRAPRQLVMLLLTIGGLVSVVLVLPMAVATRGHVLSLIGVALTAIIALSSTTFVTNAMAGLLLRALHNFRLGDFICVGEQFGRVTERGLFHTEIQTEDRDLVTLPNMHLVSNPVKVMRASGTIVSATVSLGYDVAHTVIEPLLIEAATEAKLSEPFVQIMDLGNYAVTYRVAGFLPETKRLLSTRSGLRRMMLKTLHGADIEIVSPQFMNQRVLDPHRPVLPDGLVHETPEEDQGQEQASEALIFDKADEAERIEHLRAKLNELRDEIKQDETKLARLDTDQRQSLTEAIDRRRARLASLESALAEAETHIAEKE